jgi:putative transposase
MNELRHLLEDGLELAYAVINGVEVRGKKGKYRTQRIKFNSDEVT